MSVARKWQLASHRHLLQIICRPSVLVSSVQCLTDHPCCAAGSSKMQNHNSEEHLYARSATDLWPRCWVQLIWSGVMLIWSGVMFSKLSVCDTTLNDKVSQLSMWIIRNSAFWIIAILSKSRNFPVSCDYYDLTSHLLVVCKLTTNCVGLVKCKGKGFLNKSWGFRWNLGHSPLLWHSAHLWRQDCQVTHFPPCKLLKNLFR